jgi:hypothetical protein
MSATIHKVFEHLRGLASPEEFAGAVFKNAIPAAVPRANAHIHLPPNFSAFQSVQQAVDLAADQGVRALGVSNYYDFEVYSDFGWLAWQRGIFPLFGLEIIALLQDVQQAGILINDPGNPGRMYLCGKGIVRFTGLTPVAQDLIGWIRRSDSERMCKMVDLVESMFSKQGVKTDLSEAGIVEKIAEHTGASRDSIFLQERHIAQAFQEKFFSLVPPSERKENLSAILGISAQAAPEDRLRTQAEIRSALMKVGKPAFVTERFVDFDQAYRLVLELRGIPCYPTLADGAKPICAYEDPPQKLIETLSRHRIYCAEFIPIRNKPDVLQRYVRALRKEGIVIAGGTEHNTPDLLPLEPRCVEGLPVSEEVRAIFWEGACVIAAHQFLSLHGRPGYVDASGNLTGRFSSMEDRISFFARLGETIIDRHHARSVTERVTSNND